MSLLSRALSLFQPRPPAIPFPTDSKAQDFLMMLTGYQSTKAAYNITNFEARVKEGFRKNELIYACIEATANTTASAKLCIHDKVTGEEIEKHPIRDLLKKPNPVMSEADFWRFVIANKKLAGVSYWQKIRNNAGDVIALWPMRPDWVYIVPDTKLIIGGYEYRPPGVTENEVVKFKPEDVLAFRDCDPLNVLDATAPVQVAARTADIDNHETDLIKRIWEQGGVPLGLLTSKLKLRDEDVKNIQSRWKAKYGGWDKWDTPAVLDSDATYQKMQMSFAEMGLDFLDARDETRICMAMGVPPIIIGTTAGLSRSTFSNYGEARKAWWEDTLIPLYKSLADKFNSGLLMELDDSVEARWDFSEVPALQDDKNARWTRATAALTAGGITVNMYLEEIGMENIGAEGEVFLRSAAQTPVPVGNSADDNSEGTSADLAEDDEEEKPAQPAQRLSAPAQDELAKFAHYLHEYKHDQKSAINPRDPNGYEAFRFTHVPPPLRLAAKAYADVVDIHEFEFVLDLESKAESRYSVDANGMMIMDPLSAEKDAAEKDMMAAVATYFERLKARIIANTRQAASHARKASLIPGDLQDYTNYFDDKFWQDMLDLLDASVRPHMQDAVVKGANASAKKMTAKMGIGLDPAVFNVDAAKYALKYTDKVLQKFNTTSRDGVGAILARWVGTEGATLQDLITAFETAPLLSVRRAELTAITETTRAFSQGEQIAGQEIAKIANVPYKAKGTGLEPPLHPGCRCWIDTVPVYGKGGVDLVAFDAMYHTSQDTVVCATCAPYNGKYLGNAS